MAASTNLRLVDLNSDALISSLPEVGDTPNQPLSFSFSFPKREYGRSIIVKCSFQSQWFSKWQWLHYDQSRDMAFCHTCMMAVKSKKITSLGTGDLAFVSHGYSNWKDATGALRKGHLTLTRRVQLTRELLKSCLHYQQQPEM